MNRIKWGSILVLILACTVSSYAGNFYADRVITGRVVGEDRNPLPGVSVTLKGTDRGVSTDENGMFSISIPEEGGILVFSYLGYITREIPVTTQETLDVVLSPDRQDLDQVVVIGYGTVKKSDLTGSVVSVKAEELKATPITSLDQGLQGRAAGVQVTQVSGQPGGATSIRIRGTSSINAGNEPLYVIDGMLVNDEGLNAGVTRGPRINILASINPADIESIEVLKDASATAIYGARGTNGVVLITTKQGRAGKPSINFETYYGTQRISNKVDVLNAAQFAELVNEANMNAGMEPEYENPQGLGAGTNWQEEILRTAPMANYQLSVSGGDERTRYAVSGGYFSQKGIIQNSDFDRYSFRVNLDKTLSDRLNMGTNLSYTGSSANNALTNLGTLIPGITTTALLFNPVQPIYDPAGPGGYTFEDDRGRDLTNPVADREINSLNKTHRILGNVFATYSLGEALEFKTSFGIDQFFTRESAYVPNFLKRTHGSLGEASIGNNQGITWLLENTLTYQKNIGSRHSLNAVLGHTLQRFSQENAAAVSFNFTDNRTGYYDIGAGLNHQPPSSGETSWSMISYLGRINYTLDNKYLFTLTGRVDGSSKFAAGNQYGFFPSVAVAWRLSEEEFIRDLGFFEDLKLRASYGAIGNQSIPPYQSLPVVAPYGEGVFNSHLGSEVYKGREPVNFANPDLKWESTRQLDIGLDMAFFRGRMTVTADYYEKKTFDLLMDTPIPGTTGFNLTLLNVGNVENKGFELDIRTINTRGRLQWNTALNFSTNQNKVTNLHGGQDILLGGFAPGWSILREGEAVGTFYGYVFDGIFQTDEEAATSPVMPGQEPGGANQAGAGDRRYRDVNGDEVINDQDRVVLGNAQPDFIWGINNEFSFGSLDLSFFFQGSQGNMMANFLSFDLLKFDGETNVLAEAALNRWTPSNPSNRYPRALAGENQDVNIFSSAVVEDASYVRLRNVTLGYTLPLSIAEKLSMRSLRVYVSGTNLITWTRYKGYDPEANFYGQSTSFIGADYGGYPLARTFQLGLNIGF